MARFSATPNDDDDDDDDDDDFSFFQVMMMMMMFFLFCFFLFFVFCEQDLYSVPFVPQICRCARFWTMGLGLKFINQDEETSEEHALM